MDPLSSVIASSTHPLMFGCPLCMTQPSPSLLISASSNGRTPDGVPVLSLALCSLFKFSFEVQRAVWAVCRIILSHLRTKPFQMMYDDFEILTTARTSHNTYHNVKGRYGSGLYRLHSLGWLAVPIYNPVNAIEPMNTIMSPVLCKLNCEAIVPQKHVCQNGIPVNFGRCTSMSTVVLESMSIDISLPLCSELFISVCASACVCVCACVFV